jgi:hypothetical protein
MPSYTGLQLRNGVTSSENLSGSVHFELPNNSSATTYFVIQGTGYWDGEKFTSHKLFGGGSEQGQIINAVNCTLVTGSVNAAFILNPGVTSSFTYSLNDDNYEMPSSYVEYSATNALVYSINDRTSSGSIIGINGAEITGSAGGDGPDPGRGALPAGYLWLLTQGEVDITNQAGIRFIVTDPFIPLITQDEEEITNQAGLVIEVPDPYAELQTQAGDDIGVQKGNPSGAGTILKVSIEFDETPTNRILQENQASLLLENEGFLLLEFA